MGRPREFDVDEALDEAIVVFREQGYEATSMADLIAATGVQKGSLYKLWESKHELYRAALGRHLERERTGLSEVMAGDPGAAFRTVVKFTIEQCRDRSTGGCFCTNARVELGPSDEQVRAMIAAHVDFVLAEFARSIKRAQRAGTFRSDRSAALLAQSVYTGLVGLLSRSRSDSLSRRELRALGDIILESLSPAR